MNNILAITTIVVLSIFITGCSNKIEPIIKTADEIDAGCDLSYEPKDELDFLVETNSAKQLQIDSVSGQYNSICNISGRILERPRGESTEGKEQI